MASSSRRLRECLEFYVERVSVPLAVRSSGLLEDSHRQPLAGLYATYMLPNNHPDVEVRLNHLATAVKLVYASAYVERPRRYLEAIGHDLTEARMAVIIQEVAGRRYGRYFYPAISGVAQSHNYYPVFQMKPEDGVATIALGLGKQVVEGGDAVRFCPRYPQVLPQFRSPAEVMKVAQREFFALDLERSDADLLARHGCHAGPAAALAGRGGRDAGAGRQRGGRGRGPDLRRRGPARQPRGHVRAHPQAQRLPALRHPQRAVRSLPQGPGFRGRDRVRRGPRRRSVPGAGVLLPADETAGGSARALRHRLGVDPAGEAALPLAARAGKRAHRRPARHCLRRPRQLRPRAERGGCVGGGARSTSG